MALIITIQVLYDLSKEILKVGILFFVMANDHVMYISKNNTKYDMFYSEGSAAVYFVTERMQNCDNHSHIISLFIE